MGYFDVPEIDYTRYTNRQLAAVPLAVLAVALLVLSGTFLLTGTPVPLGMDFAGGAELTVQTTSSESEIQARSISSLIRSSLSRHPASRTSTAFSSLVSRITT